MLLVGGHHALNIEDDPGVPRAGFPPNSKVVIGDALDLSVKGMAFEVQFLAADFSLNPSVADVCNLALPSNESLNIKKRQELTEPSMK